MPRLVVAFILVVVLLAPLAIGVPGSIAVQDASPIPSSVELPESPVGHELAWLIGMFNGAEEAQDEEDVAAHFTPAALEELPPAMIVGLSQQLAEAFGPFTFQGLARPHTPQQIAGYLVGRDGATFLVVVATENAAPHRMTGVGLLPVAPFASLPLVAPETRGGTFDIGGRGLVISCSGSGSPTVILEAGYADSGGLWAPVQNGVAPLTRVCSYDRANVAGGASDPAATPRTAEDQVADLHALLAAADIPGPYVLGAHSFGGLIARLYAATYPNEVVGMVLVDSVHEDRAARRQAMVTPELWATLQAMEAQFRDFERIDQAASWAQVRHAQETAPLPPMPLIALAAGRGDPTFLPENWPLAEEDALHRELQVALANLVPDGEFMLVEESGHYIQLEQPDLVIDAIRDVVVAVRSPGSQSESPGGESATPMPSASLDAVLQDGLDSGLTGVALAVGLDGQQRFVSAAGLASVEDTTSLTASDRFRIYSITKSFTAVLVLQLVDDGVLSLDDTVAAWLNDPEVARIPHVDQITLRQLLTHTSGVYDYFAPDSPFWQGAYLGEDADWSRVWQPRELLAYADGAAHAPAFAPGEGVGYSNTGYILLGLIVEKATGQAFGDRLHQQILDPLGLDDTFFPATEAVPGGTVQGYYLLGDELVNVSAMHLSAQWAAGGMVSNTHDLLRFADALYGGELLSPESLQEMVTFVPSERPGIAWGMGLSQMKTPAGNMIGMGGAGPGFVARLFRHPDLALTIVLLTNTNRDDDTVDILFEQAVQLAAESATTATVAIAPSSTPVP